LYLVPFVPREKKRVHTTNHDVIVGDVWPNINISLLRSPQPLKWYCTTLFQPNLLSDRILPIENCINKNKKLAVHYIVMLCDTFDHEKIWRLTLNASNCKPVRKSIYNLFDQRCFKIMRVHVWVW